MNKLKIAIAISIGAVFLLSSLTMGGMAVQQVTISAAGSTFVEPLFEKWAGIFYNNISSQNAQVTYAGIGSGGGISHYTAGTVNIGASDAPLQPSEQSAANAAQGTTFQLADSLGGVVLAYNLPGITVPIKLNATVIAEIFQTTITYWDDAAIAQLNPSVTLPHNQIVVVHRSDGSGTTYCFTNYLNVAAPSVWKLGQSKSVTWPASTVGEQGNPGVASEIVVTQYAIGYVEYGYALANPNVLHIATLQDKNGDYINITSTAVANAAAAAASNLPAGDGNWSAISIVNGAGSNVWPISTFTYLIVAKNQTKNGALGAAIVGFLKYIVSSAGQAYAPGLGYVELPAPVIQNALNTIGNITYNTQYNPSDYYPTSGSSTTPGFEFIFAAFGLVVIGIIYSKKKRNQ